MYSGGVMFIHVVSFEVVCENNISIVSTEIYPSKVVTYPCHISDLSSDICDLSFDISKYLRRLQHLSRYLVLQYKKKGFMNRRRNTTIPKSSIEYRKEIRYG